MVNEVEDDEEDFESGEEEMEESFEEEMESEESIIDEKESGKQKSREDDLLQNSHATSYSDWYVIDEAEEARLKQVAFEKYLAEKQIEEQIEKARLGIFEPKPPSPPEPRKKIRVNRKAKKDQD